MVGARKGIHVDQVGFVVDVAVVVIRLKSAQTHPATAA